MATTSRITRALSLRSRRPAACGGVRAAFRWCSALVALGLAAVTLYALVIDGPPVVDRYGRRSR